MFINAILIGTEGEAVEGGVDSDWVLGVFRDHSTFFNTPTQFLIGEEKQETVTQMTLADIWVNINAFRPEFWNSIPRCEGDENG